MKSLFIFRRDLRLEDNTGLVEALRNSDQVICAFILDPRQLNSSRKSDNAVQFMFESIKELDLELKRRKSRLYLFYGKAEDVVKDLIVKEKIGSVYINRDYTPFSKRRDLKIEKSCRINDIKFYSYDDCLLTSPGQILNGQGNMYTVYSAFLKKAKLSNIKKPLKNRFDNYYHKKISSSKEIKFLDRLMKKRNKTLLESGGRTNALKILRKINIYEDYDHDRNYPAMDGTTKLSAHNKFGTISIREFYWKIVENLGKNHTLIDELFWRDFFTLILDTFNHVLKQSYREKYDKIKWNKDKIKFKFWCDGKTGFPIVDAGMKELNKTGWMHNRVRMITASFLVKDLHIDWRMGEKYFAQKLLDYDPAVNNGNWQWIASTGSDAQPYFRIFNPWNQQEKYDHDCEYIKRWLPELKSLSSKEIHNPHKSFPKKINYPRPIVDHKVEAETSKKIYSKVI